MISFTAQSASGAQLYAQPHLFDPERDSDAIESAKANGHAICRSLCFGDRTRKPGSKRNRSGALAANADGQLTRAAFPIYIVASEPMSNGQQYWMVTGDRACVPVPSPGSTVPISDKEQVALAAAQ